MHVVRSSGSNQSRFAQEAVWFSKLSPKPPRYLQTWAWNIEPEHKKERSGDSSPPLPPRAPRYHETSEVTQCWEKWHVAFGFGAAMRAKKREVICNLHVRFANETLTAVHRLEQLVASGCPTSIKPHLSDPKEFPKQARKCHCPFRKPRTGQ